MTGVRFRDVTGRSVKLLALKSRIYYYEQLLQHYIDKYGNRDSLNSCITGTRDLLYDAKKAYDKNLITYMRNDEKCRKGLK